MTISKTQQKRAEKTVFKSDGLWPWQNPQFTRREQYQCYMASPFWRLKQVECFNLSGGLCAACRKRKKLTVHHVTYERMFHESQSDLLCLCWIHHRAAEEWTKTIGRRPSREEILAHIGVGECDSPPRIRTNLVEKLRKQCAEDERLGFFVPFHLHL